MTTTNRYGINRVDQGRQSGKSANYLNKASYREHFPSKIQTPEGPKSDRFEKYYKNVEKDEVEETRKDENKSVRCGFCVNSVERGFSGRIFSRRLCTRPRAVTGTRINKGNRKKG